MTNEVVEARIPDFCEDEHIVDREKVVEAARLMPAADVLSDLAETFKVLSHPGRLKIIHALSASELCVCDLSALLGSTDSAVSHQLRLLRGMRLVKFRREGKLAYYSLDDQHVRLLFEAGLEHMEEPDQASRHPVHSPAQAGATSIEE
jgi:DNA-binding transcriptional ArsR family regulator